ncbi:ABC transporter ATP-binding protein [Smaragdicoccus niigatensis]|uniref:ABC transporter ATP-binding protein n=1 Tax=Smaragdicoccus niigatensis TaxID=359359 RepID=UPI0003798486|nr:ABC transporter ATP-binding protein [Smaragdicoccus niigatensis]
MLYKLLREFLAPYRRELSIIVVIQLVAVLAMLYLPRLNADIIDNGLVKGDVPYIWKIGLVMLAVSAVQVCCSILGVYLGGRAAMGAGRDMRGALLHRANNFSAQEIGHFGAPSLITRNTNDVTQVQMLVVMGCTMLVVAPMMCIGGVFMALHENVGLSWVLLVAIIALAVTMSLIVVRLIPVNRGLQRKLDSVSRVLREQISGVRVIRAFVREEVETKRFADANAELTETSLKVGRLMAIMFPTVMMIGNVTSVAVIWFGGHLIDEGQMQIGSLTAMISYVMQVLMSVMMGSFVAMMVPRAAVSAERISAVLTTESSLAAPAKPKTFATHSGLLEFDNVTFGYPGAEEPVLRSLNFTVRPGETTAIVGATGSGKTTLINLVPRLIDVIGGSVRVGGTEIRDLDPIELREQIGLVPQKAYLFSGTVASNLRHGNPNATDDELWAALEIAQAADFVRAMPQGLDTPVAQGGTTVSGGQRQRLAIARALVRNPKIYLFDDVFSALDVATEARLRSALRDVTRDSSVIIVAQRVSSIREADQIIVLEHGEIVGIGRHEELLDSCSCYAEIVDSQAVLA